jgi:hypothetical protein
MTIEGTLVQTLAWQLFIRLLFSFHPNHCAREMTNSYPPSLGNYIVQLMRSTETRELSNVCQNPMERLLFFKRAF